MLKPVREAIRSERSSQPGQRKKRRLRRVQTLPTLLTLGNLYLGFAAIYCCGREMQSLGAGVHASEMMTLKSAFFEARAPSYLSIASLLVLAGMICDTLDGRVARRVGVSNKFGEQLDSLADVVSFGVAPAFMLIVLIQRELSQWGSPPFGFDRFETFAVLVATVYVCATGLRLARFAVEASPAEAKHAGFQGLPMPGAAGGIVSLIYLHDHLDVTGGWPETARVVAQGLPVCALLITLLMVSRIPYVHGASWFLKRRPFEHVVIVLLFVPLLVLYTEQMLAGLAWYFVGVGPVGAVYRRLTGRPLKFEPEEADEHSNSDAEIKKQAQ